MSLQTRMLKQITSLINLTGLVIQVFKNGLVLVDFHHEFFFLFFYFFFNTYISYNIRKFML